MSRMKMTVPISQGHRRDEIYVGLPWWLSGKESACQCRRHGFNPWSRKIPWRRKWQPTPVYLPGNHNGQRSLASYSPCRSQRVGCDLATELLNNKKVIDEERKKE